MLAIEPLRPGQTIEWAIEDILRHESVDLTSDGLEYFAYCVTCQMIWEQGMNSLWSELHAGIECKPDGERTLAEAWGLILDECRDDDQYGNVLSSIRMDGFVGPVTACFGGADERTTYGQLVFGDGHHRLAAAIELGYRTVPVRVTAKLHVSFDSGGDWVPGEEIPCLVPDFNHQPNRV